MYIISYIQMTSDAAATSKYTVFAYTRTTGYPRTSCNSCVLTYYNVVGDLNLVHLVASGMLECPHIGDDIKTWRCNCSRLLLTLCEP